MRLARTISRRFTTFSPTPKPNRATDKSNSIQELHAHVIRTQQHTNPYSVSPVIKAYASSPSHLHKAHLVFDQIEQPTLLVWNYMIRGLSLSDRPEEAMQMYNRLCHRGFVGDNLTFIFVLKACSRVLDIVSGQKIHALSVKLGFGSYLYVSNTLIHLYSCCSDVRLAQKVFDEMAEKDLVSWNSLICGYWRCSMFEEVLGLFGSMREMGVKGDAVTMVKVILACGHLGKPEFSDSMVEYIERYQVEMDVYLGNTLIDMYGRRGSVDLARRIFDSMRTRNIVSWNAMIGGYVKAGTVIEARKLFDAMPERDVISWTLMITGYSQANRFSEAVKLFQEMMEAKVKPDEMTVATVLSACADSGSLDIGRAIHEYIRIHNIKTDVYVWNSLIDMYCKCGESDWAMEVFHEMKEKDSVSWNSIISGLAVNGFSGSALDLFSQMLKEGVKPTRGTFVGVLLACAHAGLVDKGLELFESMTEVYGLIPEMKHYGCIVDLLSRSGNLERAYEFIEAMPVEPDVVLWRILLSACKLHGNIGLAEVVMKKLVELDPSNSGNYVLLSNAYAGLDRWDDATKARETMAESQVQKPTGWSSIEGKQLFSILE